MQVLALALKKLMRLDVNGDVQIPGSSAVSPGVTFSGNPQPRAVCCSSRHIDQNGFTPHHSSVTAAHFTSLLTELSGPAACGARFGKHHVPAGPTHLPRRVAMSAASLGCLYEAASAAGRAGLLPGDNDLPSGALHGFDKSHRQGRIEIGTVFRRGPGARRMEDISEELGERRRLRALRADGKVETREFKRPIRGRLARSGTVCVVLQPALWVHERLVRLRDLLEQSFRGAISRIDAGVITPGQSSIGPLDVGGGRVRIDAKQNVEIHYQPGDFVPRTPLRVARGEP